MQTGPNSQGSLQSPRGLDKGYYWKTFQSSKPSDYYPLLVVQASSDKITKGSLKAIKRDFRALWLLVEGSGAQTVISSNLLVTRNNIDRNMQIHQVTV